MNDQNQNPAPEEREEENGGPAEAGDAGAPAAAPEENGENGGNEGAGA